MQKDNFKPFLKFEEQSRHEEVWQDFDFKRHVELFPKNGEYCGLNQWSSPYSSLDCATFEIKERLLCKWMTQTPIL